MPAKRVNSKQPPKALMNAPPAAAKNAGKENDEPECIIVGVKAPADAAALDPSEHQTLAIPTKKGGGRGLRAVQQKKEMATTSEKADGSRTQARTKLKEQKLFTAEGNEHVETKTVTEDKRKRTRRDGSVTVTECTTVKKVCYM